jgi:RNA polymerase sigma-70 factor, ECF subfamily
VERGVTLKPDPRVAFGDLYERHAGSVYAYAARRSARDEAEDVVAETFLVAWLRIQDVPEDALPWLLGVARKVLANARRGAHRRASLGARLRMLSRHVAAGDPADEVVSHARILDALAALSPKEREARMLVAWEGLDPARAARAAGCTRATFAVRLHRAKRRLMKELESDGHPEPTDAQEDGLEKTWTR